MKILNLVIISSKKVSAILGCQGRQNRRVTAQIGALEHDKKRLGDIIAVLERYLEE